MIDQGIETHNMQERFQHLLSVISSHRFLKMQGLGNEVPFFICPFQAKESVEMERLRLQLVNSLEQNGVNVLDINLYDLSIALLKERGIWDQIIEIEATVDKAQLKELLQGVLDPESLLIPAIADKIKESPHDVMFISGVGEVFPFIRSHNILSNLQSTTKDQPTLMFFPGAYTHSLESGSSLDLFGKLHDDKYYRAFNIFHYEI